MLSDYVEIVIRVIEGTIAGRRNYSYMEGNHGLRTNGHTMIFKKGKSETWETLVQFEPVFFHVGFHTQQYISEHFRSSWVCAV